MSCPGQNNTDRVFPPAAGQAVKKNIDRRDLARRVRQDLPQRQPAFRQIRDDAPWDNENFVRRDQAAVTGFADRHACPSRQDLGQHGFPVGGEMQHDNERQTAVVRHIFKETPERVDPAGRGPNADNRYKRITHEIIVPYRDQLSIADKSLNSARLDAPIVPFSITTLGIIIKCETASSRSRDFSNSQGLLSQIYEDISLF